MYICMSVEDGSVYYAPYAICISTILMDFVLSTYMIKCSGLREGG